LFINWNLRHAEDLWNEYNIGLNGTTALKTLELEYKNQWRDWKGGKQVWSDRMLLLDFIKQRVVRGETEQVAVQVLHHHTTLTLCGTVT
jgi:hypothetical protein